MEKYPAFEERPTDRCLADVAASDYFVLILARRYGYVPPDNNPARHSITHLEYLHALAKRKPCFAFLLDEQIAWPEQATDSELAPGDSTIAAFRREVRARHGCAVFTTDQDLAIQVLQALHAYRAHAARRQLSRVAIPLALGLGAVALYLALPTPSLALSSSDWVSVLARTQERKLSQLRPDSKDAAHIRQQLQHIDKLTSDYDAWQRFKAAFSIAERLLNSASPSSSLRTPAALRNAVIQGHIDHVVTALSQLDVPEAAFAEKSFVLGAFHEIAGDLSEAFTFYAKAAQIDPSNAGYVVSAVNISLNIGLHREATTLLENQLAAAQRRGAGSELLSRLTGLKALAYWYGGRSDQARTLFVDALALAPATATALRATLLNDSVPLHNERGEYEAAEVRLGESARLWHCSIGNFHPKTVNTLLNLTAVFIRRGKFDAASDFLAKISATLNSGEYLREPYPPLRAQAQVVTALLPLQRGEYGTAEPLLRSAKAMFVALRLDKSFLAARTGTYLGQTLLSSGKASESLQELENSFGLNLQLFGSAHVETAFSQILLVEALTKNGLFRSASLNLEAVRGYLESGEHKNLRLLSRFLFAEAALLQTRGTVDLSTTLGLIDQACHTYGAMTGADPRLEVSCLEELLKRRAEAGYSHADPGISRRLTRASTRLHALDQSAERPWEQDCTRVTIPAANQMRQSPSR